MKALKISLQTTLAILTAGWITACGSESADLTVGLAYNPSVKTVEMWESFTVVPTLFGLQGNTPSIAGNILPQGVTLNSVTGIISGAAEVEGTFQVNPNLTVLTYSGVINSQFTLNVVNPFKVSYQAIRGYLLETSTSAAPTVTGLRSGDTVTFSIAPTSYLPVGLNIDSTSGQISGMMQQAAGTYDVTMLATFTRSVNGTMKQTSIQVPVSITVQHSRSILLNYPTMVAANNVSQSFASPTLTGLQAGDSAVSFTYLSSGSDHAPYGLTINPSTGAFAGTPVGNPVGTYQFYVLVSISISGTLRQANYPVSITVQ